MGKCRKFVLTRDFSCIVRRCRKYLGGVAKLFSFATPPIKISLYGMYSVFAITYNRSELQLPRNATLSFRINVLFSDIRKHFWVLGPTYFDSASNFSPRTVCPVLNGYGQFLTFFGRLDQKK